MDKTRDITNNIFYCCRAHLTAFGNLYKNCTRAVCKTEDECTTQFMIGSLPSPNKPGDEVNDVTSHGFHQSGRHRLFSFTFIRDPIPRFISGNLFIYIFDVLLRADSQ